MVLPTLISMNDLMLSDSASAFGQWLQTCQWPLCAILFLACVLVWLRTARSLRREREQRREGRP